MGILNRIKNVFKNETIEKQITMDEIIEMFKLEKGYGENLSEVTYFTCIKMLSESMGKLSLNLYQDTENGVERAKVNQVARTLRIRPNPYMTPATFWATVEFNKNQYGNSFVWVRWHLGKLMDLWILPPNSVTILVDNVGLFGNGNGMYYLYEDPETMKKYKFSHKEILHFKTGTSRDGITGISVQDILASTVEGNKASQGFMNNLYKSGLTAKASLEYTGDLNEEAKKKLIKGFEDFASGSENAGKIIPVPLGMKLTPLDIKLTDSQFFELKKYSSLQIAAAFGIKPNHINDYEKSSYSNSESQNLSFYVDTLLFILKQYEQEISYKLLTDDEQDKGIHFKFNVNSILRADTKTQMESLAIGINNAIYTPNEARNFIDMPKNPDGDILMTNGNYIPVSQVGNQYSKGGDK